MTLDFHCPVPPSIPEPESVASRIRESLVDADREFSIDRLERSGDRLRGRVVFPWRKGDGYLLQEKLLKTIAQELSVDRNDIDLEFQETLLRPATVLDR